MPRRVARKWRPPLAFVLGGTLAAVFFLPLVGIAYFRVAGGVLGWAETSWLIGWTAFAATSVLGFLLWRLVLRPVRALTDFARTAGEGSPPEHFGTPEFSELGQAVLDMTSTLRGRESLLRTYADHATHEMKSPLSAIRGAAELLEDDSLSPHDRARLLGNIGLALARMEVLLDDQRDFAKAAEPVKQGSCQLSDLLADQPLVQVAKDGVIPLHPDVAEMVIAHLVGNARENGAGQVTCTMEPDCLRISDDGPGISQGNRNRIFDPYFTTNRDTGGTGMGLPIVRRMLEAHGAEIRLADGPGTVFEILF